MYPIIITGCQRSGESIVTQVFLSNNCFAGEMHAQTHWHNPIITHRVIRPYLTTYNVDIRGQNPLPSKDADIPFPALKERVLLTMINQGYHGYQWMVHDSRILLMWRVWNDAFPDALWVLVRRDKTGIVNSCLQTRYMNAFSSFDEWSQWVDEYEDRIEMVKAGVQNWVEVWPSKIVEGDEKEIRTAVQRTGLRWNPNSVASFVVHDMDLRKV